MNRIRSSRSKVDAILRPKPLVGFPGINNSISVERRLDGLECRVSTGSYVFVVAGMALFGPVLGSLLYFRSSGVESHTPKFILAAIWFLVAVASAGFVRYAAGRPRFTVDYSTGEIHYFAWRRSSPSLVLRRDELCGVEVEERLFFNEGARVRNFYLMVTNTRNKRYALCVSTGKQLIVALKHDLEKTAMDKI